MNPLGIVLSSVALSAGAALAVVQFAPRSEEKPAAPATDPRLDRLAQSQESLAEMMKELQGRLERIDVAKGRVEQPAILDEQVAAAVAAYFARAGAPKGAANAAGKGDEIEKPFDVDAAIRELAVEGVTEEQFNEVFRRAREAGKLDALVEHFATVAKENPNNADAQVAAGAAYLQKLFGVNDLEKGTWAMKADAAFDAALKIDERHWDARFAKATSLSFWPAALGMQGKAIEHFEILRKQQESQGFTKPSWVQTYQFLGNLYEQTGKADKALETRQAGLRLFPDNTDLKERVKAATKGK
jgi:tetratricopeptide (TPR) repeat protein